MEAQLEGTMRITGDCAFVESADFDLLLVWPADRTTWNPTEQSATLTSSDGTSVTWRDGDRVSMGGGASSPADDAMTGSDWVSQREWVAQPNLDCPLEHFWIVGEDAQ